MPGPIPNHSGDLSRRRDAERPGRDRPTLTKGERRDVKIPHADKEWHPIARKMYDSLKTSGQADFYQQSDWALAYSLCDDLSDYKKQGRRSAQMAATLYSAFGNLLVSEGDRRRARIELDIKGEEETPASVAAIEDYRQGLGLVEGDSK